MDQYTFYAKRPGVNYHRIDFLLFVSMILLWGLGIFTLYVSTQKYGSGSSFGTSMTFVRKQLICSAIGFIFFMFFLLSDMNLIRKFVGLIVVCSLFLCILTFIPAFSIEKNGARRWLKMPFNFTFQPSELIKFSLVLFLANYFDKQAEIVDEDEKTVFPCFLGFVIFSGLVFIQKDFSTGLFITIIGILMFWVSGAKLTWLIPFLIVAIPLALLMISLQQYRMERIIGFLRPNDFASTVNYQSIGARRAISAGGIFGSGIGSGLVKTNSIPEVQSDYIFAGWTEAMGFTGVLAYLAFLGFFAYRAYRSVFNCPDRFSAYAGFGCTTIIVLQSLTNIMVVGGLLPSTGIQLPFFSLGGSSIIITIAMCGFILNVSRCEDYSKDIQEVSEINIAPLVL